MSKAPVPLQSGIQIQEGPAVARSRVLQQTPHPQILRDGALDETDGRPKAGRVPSREAQLREGGKKGDGGDGQVLQLWDSKSECSDEFLLLLESIVT